MKKLLTSIVASLILSLVSINAIAEGKAHKVAIHVDQNDKMVMNMALNNVANINKYYKSIGDTVEVELVAYGPGLMMFIEGKSPVADRIESMSLGMDNLTFAGCGNTHRKMSEKAGKDVPIMSEVTMVPSGVVRLIELQENGFAYVRP